MSIASGAASAVLAMINSGLRPIAVYGVQHIVIMHDTDFGNHCNLAIWQCGNLVSASAAVFGFCFELSVLFFVLFSDCDNGARQ